MPPEPQEPAATTARRAAALVKALRRGDGDAIQALLKEVETSGAVGATIAALMQLTHLLLDEFCPDPDEFLDNFMMGMGEGELESKRQADQENT
jgi:hypothetical protein